MLAASYLRFSPLASVAVWLALVAYLVVEERYRTWTERFFLGMCAGVAAYGLSDFFFFNASGTSQALVTASASLASITFVGFFLFLYGSSLYGRFRRRLLLIAVPMAVLLAGLPFLMFSSFAGNPSTMYTAVYNLPWFLPWLLFVGFSWLAGLYGITRSFLEIRRQSDKLARRIGVVLLGLAIAVVAGAFTNALEGVGVTGLPPLFSTFLALPGLLIFFAMTPSTYRGLNLAFLRLRSAEYDVKGAFLTYSDGTLIGSQIATGEEMIDADSFSATLDVIQNFMGTSFPTLRGKWLKSIRHGDYTLVMEHGMHTYLTLIVAGAENDQLRRQMIEHLEDFERNNGRVLETGRGIAADAVGVASMLTSMLMGP